MFFNYRQNNTGGSFHTDKLMGISINVIVEANSPKDADEQAERIGLYFNGCDAGRDCSCCGDRWSPTYDKGSDVPKVYDEEVTENQIRPDDSVMQHRWLDDNNPEGYIHYKNGKVVSFW